MVLSCWPLGSLCLTCTNIIAPIGILSYSLIDFCGFEFPLCWFNPIMWVSLFYTSNYDMVFISVNDAVLFYLCSNYIRILLSTNSAVTEFGDSFPHEWPPTVKNLQTPTRFGDYHKSMSDLQLNLSDLEFEDCVVTIVPTSSEIFHSHIRGNFVSTLTPELGVLALIFVPTNVSSVCTKENTIFQSCQRLSKLVYQVL